MAVIDELIRNEADGSVSFGDYSQADKKKLDNFSHAGSSLKVKTCREITRLERDGAFVYESTPGTSVQGFLATEDGVKFNVEGPEDCEITLGLAEDTGYQVVINGAESLALKSSLSGKITFSVELDPGKAVPVEVKKA